MLQGSGGSFVVVAAAESQGTLPVFVLLEGQMLHIPASVKKLLQSPGQGPLKVGSRIKAAAVEMVRMTKEKECAGIIFKETQAGEIFGGELPYHTGDLFLVQNNTVHQATDGPTVAEFVQLLCMSRELYAKVLAQAQARSCDLKQPDPEPEPMSAPRRWPKVELKPQSQLDSKPKPKPKPKPKAKPCKVLVKPELPEALFIPPAQRSRSLSPLLPG